MNLFEGQTVIYGLPFLSFLAEDGNSVYYVIEGHVEDQRRVLGILSRIRRAGGYELLVDKKWSDLIEYGYLGVESEIETAERKFYILKIETDPDKIDDTFVPCTFMEF